MDTKRVILLGGGFEAYRGIDIPIEAVPCEVEWSNAYADTGDCKNDHGERSNPKLRDQPFFHRASNGKMKKW